MFMARKALGAARYGKDSSNLNKDSVEIGVWANSNSDSRTGKWNLLSIKNPKPLSIKIK